MTCKKNTGHAVNKIPRSVKEDHLSESVFVKEIPGKYVVSSFLRRFSRR